MLPQKNIQTRPINDQVYQELTKSGTPPLLARLFAARHVHSVDELNDNLKQLIPFTQLSNCTQAATHLADAIEQKKNILIVADYDADGATACSVGMKGLRSMGAIVDFFVPNRFEHGYGLTPELADIAHQMNADLIVTVDNGISSIDGVMRARELGIDTIITDHHSPGDRVPDCIIVNPNQKDCTFPSKNLAGVGVIFYVLMALRHELRQRQWFHEQRPEPNLAALLDLVAIGTVADVVPLDSNNRILVSQGLKRIRAGKMSPGVRALFEVAKCIPEKTQAQDIGFKIAPRINASGRLDDMSIGIACLLTEHHHEAQTIAQSLNQLNQARQEIEQGMLHNILAEYPTTLPAEQMTLIVYRDDFHQGVAGIVAGRLKERFYRPTFVFAPAGNHEIRGSGRSIVGLHLRDAIDMVSKRSPQLISKFGGHAMAAGLTMHANGFQEFKDLFDEVARELMNPDILAQTHLTDGHLQNNELTIENANLLTKQVWGHGFAPPSFNDIFKVIRRYSLGQEQQHTKARLEKNGQQIDALFWNCRAEVLPEWVQTVYRPIVNEWRGHQQLQLYIDYWAPI